MTATARCPACRYRVALTLSGTFVKHYSGPTSSDRCSYSGRAPKPEATCPTCGATIETTGD